MKLKSSALHMACQYGYYEIVKLLLYFGANIYTTDIVIYK